MDKGQEHHIEFLETGEDAPKIFEATEQSLDFIASAVHGAIVFPSREAVLFRRNNGDEAKIEGQLPSATSFVGSVHPQVHRPSRRPEPTEEFAPFWRVVGIARRKGKGYRGSRVRRDEVNFGGPAATRFANGLRAVFFNAPVPSGCTLTAVLSNDTASILTRTS